MLLLFSHQLTEEQKNDAKKNWNIDEFIYLPVSLQTLWSNINPDLEELDTTLTPIYDFVAQHTKTNDLVLIQGDFGACFLMVNYVGSEGMIPVYATTKRSVEEYMEDGKSVKKTIFEHVRFREYEI